MTPTELTRLPEPGSGYVIVGGGKTAMDTALWLLGQDVDPDRITWIRPREAWLLNRANVQPTEAFAARTIAAAAAELEAARDAASMDDLFGRLEAARLLQRIDRSVEPTMYRCAIVSEAELNELRRIERVIRLGHVQAVEAHRIVLQQGEFEIAPGQVIVHCSAAGLPRGPAQPVFQHERIVPQYVRRCSPTFSAAVIAYLEATLADDEQKNALCTPVPVPEEPLDWLRMHLHTATNQHRWSKVPALQAWLLRSRLDTYAGLFARAANQGDAASTAALERLRLARSGALARMRQLLGEPL